MFAGTAFAGDFTNTIMSATSLKPTSEDATSNTVWTFDFDKLGFIVTYDEGLAGNDVSVNVTAQVSDDGSDWIDAAFKDFKAAATIMTVSLHEDTTYFMYMDRDIPKPYMRINVEGINLTTGDEATVDVILIGTK
jgi:hypothetical protein